MIDFIFTFGAILRTNLCTKEDAMSHRFAVIVLVSFLLTACGPTDIGYFEHAHGTVIAPTVRAQGVISIIIKQNEGFCYADPKEQKDRNFKLAVDGESQIGIYGDIDDLTAVQPDPSYMFNETHFVVVERSNDPDLMDTTLFQGLIQGGGTQFKISNSNPNLSNGACGSSSP